MTGEDLLEYVVGKAMLDRDVLWGLFEVVSNGQLGKTACRCVDIELTMLKCVWAFGIVVH